MERKIDKEYCKLCNVTVCDLKFEEINELMRDVLEALLIKLNWDDNIECVMCKLCCTKLFEAFDFKTTCLYTEDIIVPYTYDVDALPVCLQMIYSKEKNDKKTSQKLNEKRICRLCMQLIISEFVWINDVISEMAQNFIPEVNFSFTEDPVMCQLCFDALVTHCRFVKESLGETKRIRVSSPALRENPYANSDLNTECRIKKHIDVSETSSLSSKHSSGLENSSKTYTFQCCLCDYKSNIKGSKKKHILQHRDPLDPSLIKCTFCDFKTKYWCRILRHLLVHAAPSEIEWHECHICGIKAKEKYTILTHVKKTHKEASSVKWEECFLCDFKTKFKSPMRQHMMSHRDPQENVFKCDFCTYKTRRKNYIKNHMLSSHKEPSEIEWLRCTLCNFKAKFKGNLNQHILTHRSTSQKPHFECFLCGARFPQKSNLRRHCSVSHKNSLEIQWYRCNFCDYKGKSKSVLKVHLLRHRNESQVQWHKCGWCRFKSKHKPAWKRHMSAKH